MEIPHHLYHQPEKILLSNITKQRPAKQMKKALLAAANLPRTTITRTAVPVAITKRAEAMTTTKVLHATANLPPRTTTITRIAVPVAITKRAEATATTKALLAAVDVTKKLMRIVIFGDVSFCFIIYSMLNNHNITMYYFYYQLSCLCTFTSKYKSRYNY